MKVIFCRFSYLKGAVKQRIDIPVSYCLFILILVRFIVTFDFLNVVALPIVATVVAIEAITKRQHAYTINVHVLSGLNAKIVIEAILI